MENVSDVVSLCILIWPGHVEDKDTECWLADTIMVVEGVKGRGCGRDLARVC